MPRSKIVYQSKQEIFGKHEIMKEWIEYSGKLIVYKRKTYPVILSLKKESYDVFIAEVMDDEKTFKGNSITEVYAKLSKWLYLRGVIFQN